MFLQGGKSSCRLRQLVILGEHIEDIDGNVNRNFSPQTRIIKPSNSHQLLFNTIQADAFELFQSIAVQAFSDNFSEKQNESLRQQVMDVLFSRTQLEPLQSFVCNQIATAIERFEILARNTLDAITLQPNFKKLIHRESLELL